MPMSFGKKETVDSKDVSLKMEYEKLLSSHQLLQSQYKHSQESLTLSQKNESDVLAILYELEGRLSQYGTKEQQATLGSPRSKTPKERLDSIINYINMNNKKNVDIIEELRKRLEETDRLLQESEDQRVETLRLLHAEQNKNKDPLSEWGSKNNGAWESEVFESHQEESPTPANQPPLMKPPILPDKTDDKFEYGGIPNAVDQKPVSEPAVSTVDNDPHHKEEVQHDKKKRRSAEIKEEMIRSAEPFLSENENKISKLSWFIIFVMGSKGLSERKDIEAYIKDNMDIEKASTSLLSGEFNDLEKFGLIDNERIATGKRNNFYVHALTKLGAGVYLKAFSEQYPLVVSEKNKLVQMHDNAQHGYFIKDVKTTLMEMGYTKVTDDRKSNTFDVFQDGKNVWIPDITGYDEQGTFEYIECELGNHTQKDFNLKIYKASRLTTTLKFVVRDKTALTNCENLIRNWYISSKSNPEFNDMKIYIISLSNLNARRSFGEAFQPNELT